MPLRPDSRASTFDFSRGAFTLIEIMIVVAIIGIIMTMGIPSIVHAFKKEGMRKAVGDVVDACNATRAEAILKGTDATLTFHPRDGTLSGGGVSATFPENVSIEILGVNFVDLKDADEAKVVFHKNGTCDEFTIVLTSADMQAEKISLEVVTGLTDTEVLK
jgi:prepilin-type N-terminal cleavage/methylation domain-containing protein